MTLRRLILALLVVGMAIAPAAHAQDAPTCADDHLTGTDCQGADVNPSANGCEIKVWVGKASCDLIVPDDPGTTGTWVRAWADQGTAPEADLVVRDKATGNVLMESHLTSDPAGVDPSTVTASVGRVADDVVQGQTYRLLYDIEFGMTGSVERQLVSGTWGTAGANLGLPAGAEVTCEVTGTHSQLGAATAAAGDTPNVDLFGYANWGLPSGNPNLLYNNSFGCHVDSGHSDPRPIAPGSHGCVAQYPVTEESGGYLPRSSCGFIGEPSGVPSGVVSATTGTYTVSHEGPSGTVVDISGSGPGATPFTFTQGVKYTLTVNGDGVGAVAAGSPE
jgi:hypothetical protein